MAQISERQPTKLDYSSPTQFKFNIHQLPLVEFNSVGCNLPGINMGDASNQNNAHDFAAIAAPTGTNYPTAIMNKEQPPSHTPNTRQQR